MSFKACMEYVSEPKHAISYIRALELMSIRASYFLVLGVGCLTVYEQRTTTNMSLVKNYLSMTQ
jgi:hypothetical protein